MTFDGRWEALITIPTGGAAVSATNSGGGPTTVTVPAGDYYMTAAGGVAGLLATLVGQLTTTRPPASGAWTATMDTTAGGANTNRITISCSIGTWALVWTSTLLRDLLGYAADIASGSGASAGAYVARGVWSPDCPLDIDGHPRMAPVVTDRRGTESPLGEMFSLVGNSKRQHRGLRYPALPLARVRATSAAAAGLTNGSLESFFADAQDARGHAWFRVGAPVQIYDTSSSTLGDDATTAGWYLHQLPAIGDLKQVSRGWTGLWSLEVPRLTAKIATSGAAITWTVDATSGKGTPANATEWVSVLAAAGVSRPAPSRLWLCQDAAGGPVDSISADNLTVVTASPGYLQTVSGWSRKALTYADAGTGSASSTSVITASTLVMMYAAVTATPAALRTLGFSQGYIQVDTARKASYVGATTATSATALTGNVQPIVAQTNRTATTMKLATDADIVAPGYVLNDNRLLYIGAASLTAPASAFLYAVGWTGANAEWTQAEIKAVLQTLGWTIPWT